MTRRYYANGDPGTSLTAGVSSSDTTLSVASAASLPSSTPFAVILEKGTANVEICLVTNVSGTSLTVTRGYNSSTALSHSSGSSLVSGVIALDFDDAAVHVAATSSVHGVTGDLVGATQIQTLTNKTLTSPILTSATSSGTLAGTSSTWSGTVGVTGALTAGSAGVTGALTAGSAAVTGAVTADTVDAQIIPHIFANEAAAGSATLGKVVAFSAPTTPGYVAGIYRGNGTIWVPLSPTLFDSNAIQVLTHIPTTAEETPSGTGTWTTFGTATVPPWATSAVATVSVCGAFDLGGGSSVRMQIKIGSVVGASSARLVGSGENLIRFNETFSDTVSGIATGAQTVVIQTIKTGGQYRIDTNSSVSVQLTFRP